jgi:hypothetical protein
MESTSSCLKRNMICAVDDGILSDQDVPRFPLEQMSHPGNFIDRSGLLTRWKPPKRSRKRALFHLLTSGCVTSEQMIDRLRIPGLARTLTQCSARSAGQSAWKSMTGSVGGIRVRFPFSRGQLFVYKCRLRRENPIYAEFASKRQGVQPRREHLKTDWVLPNFFSRRE